MSQTGRNSNNVNEEIGLRIQVTPVKSKNDLKTEYRPATYPVIWKEGEGAMIAPVLVI